MAAVKLIHLQVLGALQGAFALLSGCLHMKAMRTALCALVALSAVPAWAKFKPGHYDMYGQQICLVADGSWFGTSFPNWNGGWQQNKLGITFWGNFAEGYGNDAAAFFPDSTGHWQEWRDDHSYQYLAPHVRLVYLTLECPPPMTEFPSGAARGNPLQR